MRNNLHAVMPHEIYLTVWPCLEILIIHLQFKMHQLNSNLLAIETAKLVIHLVSISRIRLLLILLISKFIDGGSHHCVRGYKIQKFCLSVFNPRRYEFYYLTNYLTNK